MKLRTGLMAAVACVTMAAAANAVPVTGQLSLDGYAAAVGSTGMGGATGIDFVMGTTGSKSPGTAGGLTSYGAGSGSFTGLSCANTAGTCGSIKDITNFASQGSLSSFISITTTGGAVISFDLANVVATNYASDNRLGIAATGFINYTGFDRTAGTFNLTAQGDNITSFSATTLAANAPSAVPEPLSLSLLGTGLVGLGMVRRKKA